mgnify:CR=1 FL=1
MVLLYRNIALLYIYIGEKQDKILNYKKANDYFEKVLECAKEGDEILRLLMQFCILLEIIWICAMKYPWMMSKKFINSICVDCVTIYLGNGEKLSEEHAYILMHNMGRLFYHISEKEDMPQLRKRAQELYIEVLKMEFVKRDKEKFALANLNLGMAYQYDCAGGTENLEKALSHYEIALNIYKRLEHIR